MEDFEVRRRAEGGEEGSQFVKLGGTVEFFEPVDEFPELRETVKFMVIDVNCEQLIACVRQDHVEERDGCLLEVNDGPQGRIAESDASPAGTDTGEREQHLGAIRPNGELKDLAEDFR